jgi:2-isopropylmalate synthase
MTDTTTRPASDLHVYDTTLRDGAQQEGLNLSVADKLGHRAAPRRARRGVHRGRLARGEPQGHRVLPARAARARPAERDAGRVRRHPPRGSKAADDPLVRALLASGAPVVTLVAKSHVRHVEEALRTTREENLAMIRDT